MKQSEVIALQRKAIGQLEKQLEAEKEKSRILRSDLLDIYLLSNGVLKACLDLTDEGRRALAHVPIFCVQKLGQCIGYYQKKVKGK